jgi:putative tricarboxylic transport membrane protein
MESIFNNVLLGFSVALTSTNLFYCFVGVLIGTLIGVLPGLGPPAAIALLLPATFQMNPVAAIIMMSGIYYGAMFGGSTTSILVNIPGETASVVTCLDGYQMARQGKAGRALGISAFGSFIAGTLGIIGLMFLAPVLVRFALRFGPPEYFSLMTLGIVLIIFLAQGSVVKSLLMATVGLLLSTVGTDIISGDYRFTFNQLVLMDGIGLIPITMGIFGVAEVLSNIVEGPDRKIYAARIKGLFPTKEDWKRCVGPIFRGSVIGFFLGILPGGGAVLSSFASYATEKRFSKTPEKFGTGMIEGVAGPEAANNAGSSGAFVPLLTLGLPSNVVTALLVGALIIHGMQPGPLMMTKRPDLFWGLITSMYVGNIILLILNLPLIGVWVQLLKVPYMFLFPFILLFSLIGVFSLNNNLAEIFLMILFGVFGFLVRKFGYEAAPLILALVLGPMMENAFRQSLILSGGSFSIFLERPIALTLIGSALILLIFPMLKNLGRKTVQQLKA